LKRKASIQGTARCPFFISGFRSKQTDHKVMAIISRQHRL
jgi:hypothetical protein